jgi:cyclohexyl-isocyanide hydratase
MKNTGILVFDRVEELDFVGPLEVFGMTSKLRPNTLRSFTVAQEGKDVKAVNGLRVIPDYSFQNCPKLDLILIPGGIGSRTEMKNSQTLNFIKSIAENCELILSVCTGALILAAAGLLNGKKATTHWAALDELKAFPNLTVEHQRYVRDGKIITSAGVSAGIDMALYVIKELYGLPTCKEVAHRMEYVAHAEQV